MEYENKFFDGTIFYINIYNFKKNFEKASKITLIKTPKVDKYLIPPTFTLGLYQKYFKDEPLPIECEFLKSLKPNSISHIDEYLALRNIILVSRRPNLNTLLDKIPARFQPKFISLFKFFIINGIIDIDLIEKKSKKILSFYPPPKKSVKIFYKIRKNTIFYFIFFIDCDHWS